MSRIDTYTGGLCGDDHLHEALKEEMDTVVHGLYTEI